jgi:phosphate transport system substrate-binding protein
MVALSSDTHRDKAVKYTYAGTSSSEGKRSFVTGQVHFAGSDSALSAQDKLAAPGAWFVPSLAGGVAVGFNVPGIKSQELRIPREALADVFLGKIWQWSGLAPWNPKLAGVAQNISIVVRSESSGTTSVFTSALSSFSAEWKSTVGSASLPKWPKTALRSEGNSGVAIGIKLTEYSIGYLNVGDALTYTVSYANISNSAGKYVAPTLAAVQAATNTFGPMLEVLAKNGSTNFYVDTVDPKDEPEAYPIATFTYIAFNPARLDCEALTDVLVLLFWAWTDQQAHKLAMDHQLVPISQAVRAACLSALATLECEAVIMMQGVQLAFGLGCNPGTQSPVPRSMFPPLNAVCI